MKKNNLPTLLVTLLTACNGGGLNLEKVALNLNYYNHASIVEFQLAAEFNSLVESDDSFIVYVYSPICSACIRIAPFVENFVDKNEIQIFKLNSSMLEFTSLDEVVPYTPYFVIYEAGEIAYKVEDTQIYKNESTLSSWLLARIKTFSEIDVDDSNSTMLN